MLYSAYVLAKPRRKKDDQEQDRKLIKLEEVWTDGGNAYPIVRWYYTKAQIQALEQITPEFVLNILSLTHVHSFHPERRGIWMLLARTS